MLTAADTAYSIATVRTWESQRAPSERLFEDPYAPIFSAAGAHAAEGTQRFVELPLLVDLVRLRTRFIDDFVREGLAAGVDQLVLLGAGFDARALRMREIANHRATVFEVDFAAQLEKKRTLLEAAGVALPPWLEQVACDFNEPEFDTALTARLVEHGFRIGAGALFVWEGVIAYIGTDAVACTLRFAASVGGPRTRLVFDFAPIGFEPDPAAERTRRAGFTRFEQVGADELWRRYHLPADPPENASFICMGTAFV